MKRLTLNHHCCISPWGPRLWLFLCSGIIIILPTALSSSTGNDSSVGPIPHLESSLAASAAQGTTVAVSACLEDAVDCAVLLTRTPRPEGQDRLQSSLQEEDADVTATSATSSMGGLRVMSDHDKKRWTHLGNTAVCCMTGFVPDVQHMQRVVLRHVESHNSLYAASIPSSKLIRLICNHLDRATRAKGGRPWGVQVLLLVLMENTNKIMFCTMDPTGGYRRSLDGGFAVIGRYAEEIRQSMLKDGVSRPLPQQALQKAMRAMLEQVRVDKKDDVARYDALLVWSGTGPSSCQTAVIHPDTVTDCHECVIKELQQEQQNKAAS